MTIDNSSKFNHDIDLFDAYFYDILAWFSKGFCGYKGANYHLTAWSVKLHSKIMLHFVCWSFPNIYKYDRMNNILEGSAEQLYSRCSISMMAHLKGRCKLVFHANVCFEPNEGLDWVVLNNNHKDLNQNTCGNYQLCAFNCQKSSYFK